MSSTGGAAWPADVTTRCSSADRQGAAQVQQQENIPQGAAAAAAGQGVLVSVCLSGEREHSSGMHAGLSAVLACVLERQTEGVWWLWGAEVVRYEPTLQVLACCAATSGATLWL